MFTTEQGAHTVNYSQPIGSHNCFTIEADKGLMRGLEVVSRTSQGLRNTVQRHSFKGLMIGQKSVLFDPQSSPAHLCDTTDGKDVILRAGVRCLSGLPPMLTYVSGERPSYVLLRVIYDLPAYRKQRVKNNQQSLFVRQGIIGTAQHLIGDENKCEAFLKLSDAQHTTIFYIDGGVQQVWLSDDVLYVATLGGEEKIVARLRDAEARMANVENGRYGNILNDLARLMRLHHGDHQLVTLILDFVKKIEVPERQLQGIREAIRYLEKRHEMCLDDHGYRIQKREHHVNPGAHQTQSKQRLVYDSRQNHYVPSRTS